MGTERIEFTEGMNEVSGFGGFYERCCRAGVCAGAVWCLSHPDADLRFRGLKGVLGFIESGSRDAKALERAIVSAMVTSDDGTKGPLGDVMTLMQYHVIVNHVLFIATHGWKTYQRKMSAPFTVYRDDGTKVTDGTNR